MQDQPTPDNRQWLKVPGHPGIYRKGTRYLVKWRHQGRPKARSFRTLSEAVRFKASTVAGDTKPTSREPFKRYAARWVETYTGRTSKGVSASTRATYADVMNRVIVPFFKNTRLDQIDPPLIRDSSPASPRRAWLPARCVVTSRSFVRASPPPTRTG